MITHIKGIVDIVTERSVILDSGDVGREIFLPVQLLEKQKRGGRLELYTHLYLRDDRMELYGFAEFDELLFFRQLIDVSGVGPKSAMTVMSLAPVSELKQAIAGGDASLLMKVSGIGKKTAERLIVELKGKLEAYHPEGSAGTGSAIGDSQAIDGLVGLGYTISEAREALRHVDAGITDTQGRVKAALKLIGKNR